VELTAQQWLGPEGRPTYQLEFYALNKRGETGSAALYPSRYAVHDGSAARVADCAHLYPGR
jgi:N4-(beta-N-acetylglucosaminyl)-L-asparaginase